MLVSNRVITPQRSSFKYTSYSHDFFLLDNFFKNWPSNFSGGPMAKTLCSQCRGLRFNP